MAEVKPRIEVKALGLEEVTASVRELARTARGLAGAAADVAERELAMAIRIAASLRDQFASREGLKEARELELPARLREDAHGLVDVLFDAGSVAALTALRFFERFVDESRRDPRAA